MRASGNSSTAVIRPIRMSSLSKSSMVATQRVLLAGRRGDGARRLAGRRSGRGRGTGTGAAGLARRRGLCAAVLLVGRGLATRVLIRKRRGTAAFLRDGDHRGCGSAPRGGRIDRNRNLRGRRRRGGRRLWLLLDRSLLDD